MNNIINKIDNVYWFLSSLCNSRCKMCNYWQHKEKEEIHIDKIRSIVNDSNLIDKNNTTMGISAEPTLYTYINELVEFFNEEEFRYFLITNCIATKKIKKILNSNFLKNISISLDAFSEKHDEIRGTPGLYNKIIDTIEWIQKNHPETNIRIGYTVMPYNTREDLKSVIKFTEDNGFDLKLMVFEEVGLYDTSVKDTSLYKFNDLVDDEYMKYYNDWKAKKINLKCEGIRYNPTILYNGDVILCMVKNIILGNIYDNDFDIIWNSELAHKEMEKYYNCDDCYMECYRKYDMKKYLEENKNE